MSCSSCNAKSANKVQIKQEVKTISKEKGLTEYVLSMKIVSNASGQNSGNNSKS